MLVPIALGSIMIIANMAIQLLAVVLLIRHFMNRQDSDVSIFGFFDIFRELSLVMVVMLVGHLVQFATWAWLFMYLGEFQDFATAYYHSAVNFASLGYGDIVMSAKWRLLGALEAANGVLMFGLTAGTILSVMGYLFQGQRKEKS